jgi:hypothetical protein
MDHHNPNSEDFTKLGTKHEDAKRVGEDWQAGRYASAKNKLQDAMRKAALDDIQKELQRCEQAAEEAAKANEDPPHRDALETKLKKLIPGTTPGVTILRITTEEGGKKYITDRAEIDEALASYWSKVFSKKDLREEDITKLEEWMSSGVLQNAGSIEVQPLGVDNSRTSSRGPSAVRTTPLLGQMGFPTWRTGKLSTSAPGYSQTL